MPTPQRGFGQPGFGPRGPGAGGPDDMRNMIMAIVLSALVFLGYEFTFGAQNRERAAQQEKAAAAQQVEAPKPARLLERSEALAQSPRVKMENAELDGSIALIGARFDDLSLKRYRQKVAKDSPEVSLLNPQGTRGGYDAYLAWGDPYTNEDIVAARTPWTADPGPALSPTTPVVLRYATADGLSFTRTISIDNQAMFTVTDTVENTGQTTRALRPFSVVRRRDLPPDFLPNGIIHQGLLGVIGPEQKYRDETYQQGQDQAKKKAQGKVVLDAPLVMETGKGGWLGISDHYWLTAVIPPRSETIQTRFDATPKENYIDFRASYWGGTRKIAPGAKVTYTQQLFSGAKRVDVLQTYQKTGIPEFDRAVDWGNFWFLTRPMFMLLDFLGKFAGNFGLGILLTTVVVKLVLFPLVNTSFESMSKMRKVQPKMKEIQERFASDKERQQQEMMKLYQTEKINPVAGCLPIFAQIPVFYALYKTLSVTIEMRHAEFFGWIKDLSARDPTNLFNLFGLLPFDPTHLPLVGGFLWLGVLPILYGLSMWATQSLSPQATDPTQKIIFQWMPVFFTFIMSSFAAGLLIYWIWSNTLSFIQQYIIMRKNGVETELDKFIAKRLKPAPS